MIHRSAEPSQKNSGPASSHSPLFRRRWLTPPALKVAATGSGSHGGCLNFTAPIMCRCLCGWCAQSTTCRLPTFSSSPLSICLWKPQLNIQFSTFSRRAYRDPRAHRKQSSNELGWHKLPSRQSPGWAHQNMTSLPLVYQRLMISIAALLKFITAYHSTTLRFSLLSLTTTHPV